MREGKLKMKKQKDKFTQKEIMVGVLFFLSFRHPLFILIFFALLLYNALYLIEDAIKGLVLIAIRTIINPSLAINIDSVQIFKWLVLFALCFIILSHSRNYILNATTHTFIFLETFFCIYICIISFFNSTYPLVSIFKCFSYGFVFICVVVGISCSEIFVDWSMVLYRYLTALMLGSLIISPLPVSYYSNAHWFMGATNQSQMFGITAVIYSAFALLQIMKGNRSLFQYLMIISVMVLTFFSGSRTGLIATILCVLYGYYIEVIKNRRLNVLVVSVLIMLIVLFFYAEPAQEIFRNFILKDAFGTSTSDITINSITASRRGQYEIFLNKFDNNKWIGSGFMVPYVAGVQSWEFSFGLLVENGNLFYSILGDLGIVGFLFFIFVYGYIWVEGEKKDGRIVLFVAPFLVCMGEMIFFSTNNNAILLYVMFAIFLLDKDETELIEKE